MNGTDYHNFSFPLHYVGGGSFWPRPLHFLMLLKDIHPKSWNFVTFSFLLYLKLVNLFGKNFPGGAAVIFFFTRCPANFLIKKYKKIAFC